MGGQGLFVFLDGVGGVHGTCLDGVGGVRGTCMPNNEHSATHALTAAFTLDTHEAPKAHM